MASERRGRSRERSVEIIESRTSRDANPRAYVPPPSTVPLNDKKSQSISHVLEERVVISCWFSKLIPERPSMTD